MKDKDIYDLLKEYKFDFSEEVEEPINDLDRKKIKDLVKLKVKEDKKTSKRKSLKPILITALIALIIISSFSPMGKKVIAEIKEKLFFNPGLGVVSTEEEIYILGNPLIVDEKILIKSILSQKDGLYLEIFVENKGAKKLKEINENVKLKTGEEILKVENHYSASSGNIAFSSLYFKTNEFLKEVTLLVYDKEVKVNLEKPNILYGYDEVGVVSFDNGIQVGANKYFFDNKTYISLWSKELYENNEITSLSFDVEDIIAIDSEGKEYKVFSSSIIGYGREFYIDEIIDKPLEIKINKLTLKYNIDNQELIKLDIPKEDEAIEVNKEVEIESINKSLILKEIKSIKNENGDVIELLIDLNEEENEKNKIISIFNSKRSGYSQASKDGIAILDENEVEEANERIYGIWKEDLSSKENKIKKVYIELNHIVMEKKGEWKFILE